MTIDADPDFEPIEYKLKVDPELNEGEIVFRVYDPIPIPIAKHKIYQVRGIDRYRFPIRVQDAFRSRPPCPISPFRPPVLGETEKLDRLMNWYAPLHNLSKDAALAKCVTRVSYRLWLWKRPKFGCPPSAPLSEFRLLLRGVEVIKFPEGV